MAYDDRIENIENRQATYYAIGKDEQKFHEGFINEHNSELKARLSAELYAKELLSTEKEKSLKENKAKNLRKKLEQELLSLKEWERRRQYLSLATMIPFALFMAIELEAVCSSQVLLGVISGVLSHTILPFTVLSLLCTLYLIYNNKKIAQKEQELENLESEEEAKNVKYDFFNDAGQCLNYIEVAITTLTIVAGVIGEVSSFESGGGAEVAGDAIFFVANLVAFFIALASCIKQYKKHATEEVKSPNPDEKHTKKTNSNMSVAGLTLAGSSIFLIRRIMLMLSTSSLDPSIGPALGLAGIMFFFIGQISATCSYSKELTDVKVSGKGASLGLGVNSNTRGRYTPTEVGAAI